MNVFDRMGEDKGERRGANGGGRGFSLGWWFHPRLKDTPFVSGGNTTRY
jgi:hypothetical protein